MEYTAVFFLNSVLFGVGLAMDAFSVSMANGLNEPDMKKRKMLGIAGTFSFFQIIMPLAGWICVHTIAEAFQSFQKVIPYIALVLLCFIGGKMLIDAVKNKDDEEKAAVGLGALMVQGVATSIDALSVGFTISDYNFNAALVEAVIIGAVTFIICVCGLLIGRKFGTKLKNKASILGGAILIAIGLEIFISGIIK